MVSFRFGTDDEEHALLGLGEHDFVGGHGVFTPVDIGDIDADAASAAICGFDGGAAETGSAEVLKSYKGTGSGSFQAGFDEDFFQEGVAYLDGGTHFFIGLEGAGGEGGSAVDAVASGGGAGEDEEVVLSANGGADEFVVLDEADAEGVDEGVAGVGVREGDFAADVGDADAVAVPGDAAYDAVEEVAVVGVVEGAESEGIEEGDGAGAHGEDVAHDAADTGGGSLEGFDGGGVVVGLDFEDDGEAVADVDGSGVFLAKLRQDAGAGRWEEPEEGLGVLVAAVFAPEGAEDAELEIVGFAVEDVYDAAVFVLGEGEFGEFFSGAGCHSWTLPRITRMTPPTAKKVPVTTRGVTRSNC